MNSENANRVGTGPSHDPRPSLRMGADLAGNNPPRIVDGPTVAAVLEVVLQAVADALRPSVPPAQRVPVLPEVPRSMEQEGCIQRRGLDKYREEYGRVLKTIDSTRPDDLIGEGGPGRMTHWFSHFEGLFRILDCSESEKVYLASLQLQEEDKRWWESTGLADSPGLSWSRFKTLMEDRFSLGVMGQENRQEFMNPQTGGLKRPAQSSDVAKSSRARVVKAPRKCTQHSGKVYDPTACHNCGAPGHKNFNCRHKKRLCFSCKGRGHMQHFCPKGRRKGPIEQSNRPIFSPVEAPNPSMPVTAQYEGRVPVAYWDLGQRLYMAHKDGPYAPDV